MGCALLQSPVFQDLPRPVSKYEFRVLNWGATDRPHCDPRDCGLTMILILTDCQDHFLVLPSVSFWRPSSPPIEKTSTCWGARLRRSPKCLGSLGHCSGPPPAEGQGFVGCLRTCVAAQDQGCVVRSSTSLPIDSLPGPPPGSIIVSVVRSCSPGFLLGGAIHFTAIPLAIPMRCPPRPPAARPAGCWRDRGAGAGGVGGLRISPHLG